MNFSYQPLRPGRILRFLSLPAQELPKVLEGRRHALYDARLAGVRILPETTASRVRATLSQHLMLILGILVGGLLLCGSWALAIYLVSDATRFKDVAAGIQNLAVAMAVIVGGVWTVYTFSILGTREKAKAELFKQAVLQIEVDARQERIAGVSSPIIGAVVKITNTGNRNTFLDFKEPPLSVTRIDFDNNGTAQPGFSRTQPHLFGAWMVLRTGATVQFPYFLTVTEPGLYVVAFRVLLTSEEKEESDKISEKTVQPADRVYWPGYAYIVVTQN